MIFNQWINFIGWRWCGMKLFIKEHLLLIMVQCLQFSIILLIIWLDGYDDWKILLYAFFIGLFFLSGYLIYQYMTHRNFYKRLEKEFLSLDESLEKTGSTAVSEAFDELIRSQYRMYIKKIKEIESTKEQHLEFIDRWVHQMKTPLSVIELTAQNLDEPDSSSIREETERISNGLHTVLSMARLRTIKDDFHIKPVYLEKLIHEVNQENKRFFIRNKVYPKLEKGDGEWIVESDEKWLFFVITQLIHNGVKYSTGKTNKISLSLYEREEAIVLEIKDYGIGIPVVDQKRIFQPFFTGENGRKYRESTGMGLYLVKETLDYLGHSIEMKSVVEEGTTFRIIFETNTNLT